MTWPDRSLLSTYTQSSKQRPLKTKKRLLSHAPGGQTQLHGAHMPCHGYLRLALPNKQRRLFLSALWLSCDCMYVISQVSFFYHNLRRLQLFLTFHSTVTLGIKSIFKSQWVWQSVTRAGPCSVPPLKEFTVLTALPPERLSLFKTCWAEATLVINFMLCPCPPVDVVHCLGSFSRYLMTTTTWKRAALTLFIFNWVNKAHCRFAWY